MPLDKHPEVGIVVKVVYTGSIGSDLEYYAKWDGIQWLSRVPYSIDGWEPMSLPAKGWRYLEKLEN